MAIQTGVAMGLATAFGDILDASRYYWAVIAVFVTFMGANNSGEQSKRAAVPHRRHRDRDRHRLIGGGCRG